MCWSRTKSTGDNVLCVGHVDDCTSFTAVQTHRQFHALKKKKKEPPHFVEITVGTSSNSRGAAQCCITTWIKAVICRQMLLFVFFFYKAALVAFSSGRQNKPPSGDKSSPSSLWVCRHSDFAPSALRSCVWWRAAARGMNSSSALEMLRQPDWDHIVAGEFCWAGSCRCTRNLPGDQFPLHHWWTGINPQVRSK